MFVLDSASAYLRHIYVVDQMDLKSTTTVPLLLSNCLLNAFVTIFI